MRLPNYLVFNLINFFKQGYFDDTVNTDNAWVEVHVANVHIEGNFSTVPPAVSITILVFMII